MISYNYRIADTLKPVHGTYLNLWLSSRFSRRAPLFRWNTPEICKRYGGD